MLLGAAWKRLHCQPGRLQQCFQMCSMRASSCFTLEVKLHSLLPTPGHLYQGRATQKLVGTQRQGCHEETASGVSPAHGGGGYSACTPGWLDSPWTGPTDMHLIHSTQEMKTREAKQKLDLCRHNILGHCQEVLHLKTCLVLQVKLISLS